MNIINTLKTIGIATLVCPFITVSVPETAQAGTAKTLVYNIGHSYKGVHRCGSRQANLYEAQAVGRRKVDELRRRYGGDVLVKLVGVSPINARTRRWKEITRFGTVKGRKCKTTMTVKVYVRRKHVGNW